jgi:MFS family permease
VRSSGWKVRFISIWTGQTVSLLGSKLVSFALTWWLTEKTGSAAVLATSNLVILLPGVVLGPLVGALIDRWSRRWTMVVADAAIALCTAVLAYLYWRDIVAVWHVYVILFLRAVGGIFHDPAMTASTSLMVPREHLARVGGMNATRRGVNRVLGAPLGAFLLLVAPIEGILAIDILTFVDVPQPEPQAPRERAAMGDGARSWAIRRRGSATSGSGKGCLSRSPPCRWWAFLSCPPTVSRPWSSVSTFAVGLKRLACTAQWWGWA